MNCKLRALEPTDFSSLVRAENDQDAYMNSDNYLPFSQAVLEKYLNGDHNLFTHHQYRFVIDVDSSCAGFIDLYDYNPVHSRAGVGVFVFEEYRNKGIAYFALEHLSEISKTRLNIEYLHASVSENNKASLKLFNKSGFDFIGKRTAWKKKSGIRTGVNLYEKVLI